MYVCVLMLSFLFTPDINFIADGSEAQKLDKSFDLNNTRVRLQ